MPSIAIGPAISVDNRKPFVLFGGMNVLESLDLALRTCEADVLKLDGTISRMLGANGDDDPIVRAIIQLAHALTHQLSVLRKDGTHSWLRPDGKAQVSVVYEAGPTGYGLHRELCRRGYRGQIVAPSLIPRRAGERIKNDRRDCLRLAELSRAGELKAIWVPDEAHEAMRNLWRAREDAVGMRLKTRQQLQAFLLRHGRHFDLLRRDRDRVIDEVTADGDCFFSCISKALGHDDIEASNLRLRHGLADIAIAVQRPRCRRACARRARWHRGR